MRRSAKSLTSARFRPVSPSRQKGKTMSKLEKASLALMITAVYVLGVAIQHGETGNYILTAISLILFLLGCIALGASE